MVKMLRIFASYLAGLGVIGIGIWRLLQPIDQRTLDDSAAMNGLMETGRSVTDDIARIVRPAMLRTHKLAVDPDLIQSLLDHNPARQTAVCNRAVVTSTEVDAIALFDAGGKIVAINTVYDSGEPISPNRIAKVLQGRFDEVGVIQRCLRSDLDSQILEFQTNCSITPALFDSTGLSIAYSEPVRDPKTGLKIGVISARLRFERLLDLISNRSIAGQKNSIQFVTDQGGYFSDEITSGRLVPPIPTPVLAAIVDPLVKGGAQRSISQYAENDIGLFRLQNFKTLEGGGIQVMLIASKNWIARDAQSIARLWGTSAIAAGSLLLVLGSLLDSNDRLRQNRSALRDR